MQNFTQDLFTIPEPPWSKNNNSVPVVAGNNVPSVTRDVAKQQNVVATAGAVSVKTQNTNSVVGQTVLPTAPAVSVQQQVTNSTPTNTLPTTVISKQQQNSNPVVTTSALPTTANILVQQTKNISIETDPVQQEEIKPVVTQTGNIPPAVTGDVLDNQETITPVVALDVAPMKENVEQEDDNSTCSDNIDNISNYSNAPTGVVDAISLMEMEFPTIISIVENLLNVGVAVLASMPKLGKSWFCLLLCIAVATGKEFLGFATNKCEVLYLSFESTMRSLQNRLRMLLQGEEIPRGIHFSTEVKTLDDGLLDFLQETIDKNPKIKLIIVDTYQFIRPQKSNGDTLYKKEYGEMSQLKEFADKNGLCILCVTHLKNTAVSKDVFQQIYGSNRYQRCYRLQYGLNKS